MEETQVYKLYVQPMLKLALALGFIAFAGTGVALLLPSLLQNSKAPPPLVGVMFLVILFFSLLWILSVPTRITLTADGTVEFICRWRKWTMRAEAIQSIKPEGGHLGIFVVRTDRGKIRILAQFDGFHDFLTRLKARHPAVELRGC
jgi:hypothetical protein